MAGKKKWVTPKLIVLARGKPEERVLSGCKNWGRNDGPGPANCHEEAPNDETPCNEQGDS